MPSLRDSTGPIVYGGRPIGYSTRINAISPGRSSKRWRASRLFIRTVSATPIEINAVRRKSLRVEKRKWIERFCVIGETVFPRKINSSQITATFTGPPEKSLLPKTAEPAAPCATYCYTAIGCRVIRSEVGLSLIVYNIRQTIAVLCKDKLRWMNQLL